MKFCAAVATEMKKMLKFTTDGQDDGLADRRRTDDGWCSMTIAHFSFKFAQVRLKISTARVRKKFLTRARNLSLKKAKHRQTAKSQKRTQLQPGTNRRQTTLTSRGPTYKLAK